MYFLRDWPCYHCLYPYKFAAQKHILDLFATLLMKENLDHFRLACALLWSLWKARNN